MAPSELDRFLQLANTTQHDRPAPRSGAEIARFAADHDIRLAPADLWSLTARSRSGDSVCPPSIASFIVRLLKGVQPERVLDPFVGLGTLLQPVLTSTQASRFVGTHPNEDALQAAEWLQPIQGASEYRICDPQGEALARLGEFDLVVCLPPFNFRRREFSINGITMRDSGELELLLRSSLLLAPHGLAIFVLSPRVHFAASQRSVMRRLPDFGLHLDASFHVPEGAFMPLTIIAANIVVIRRGPAPTSLFAGQVTEEKRRLKALLSNYQKRKPGRTPELGLLVSPSDYRGLDAELSKHRIASLTGRLDLQQRDLSHYVLDIIRCPRNEGKITPKDNAFFLPLVATSNCRSAVSELPRRPDGFAQVVVDPEKADSRVIAGYFDSPLGRQIRDSRASGISIRRVPFRTLARLPVWLPDLEKQHAVIELDQRLRSVSTETNELRAQLWRRLDRSDDILRRLNQLNRKDTFRSWLDTLPYPLATILWAYHALKVRPLKGYHQLDLFFEGLAAFLGIWLMSGVKAASQDLFDAEWKTIRSSLKRPGISLERASFGTWVKVVERLAKTVRSRRGSEVDDAHYWETTLACDSPELLQNLVSKSMVAILNDANNRRNDWRAHGGALSDTEAERRTAVLLDHLADFRELVGFRWEEYPLVLPESFSFSEGVYQCVVSSVTGTHYPFLRRRLDLNAALEDRQLHFVSPLSGNSCQILPLVRLAGSSSEERIACYFYNRLAKGDRQRYISYHFEGQPHVETSDPAATKLLRELNRQD